MVAMLFPLKRASFSTAQMATTRYIKETLPLFHRRNKKINNINPLASLLTTLQYFFHT